MNVNAELIGSFLPTFRDSLSRLKLRNEDLNDLYCSTNIGRVVKSIKMIWAVHVARMGNRRGVYRVLVGKPEGKTCRISVNLYGGPTELMRIFKWV